VQASERRCLTLSKNPSCASAYCTGCALPLPQPEPLPSTINHIVNYFTRIIIQALPLRNRLLSFVIEVADLRDAFPVQEATTQTPRSLQSVPNEMIPKFITFIPFSTGTFTNMSMVNHRIHSLMSDSKQLLVDKIAEIQFWEANLIRGDTDAHSVASLKSLR
jgi:hypothetical protein